MSGRQNRAAKRYARAIFDVVEPARYDVLLDILDGLSDAWSTSDELRNVVTNPSINTSDKQKVVEGVASSFGIEVTPSERSFLALLVSAGRFPVIATIRDDVRLMVTEFRKALSLSITSAAELPSEEKDSISGSLRSTLRADVGIEWLVDPKIIGGLVIRLGDKLLDRSLAGMLQQMRSHVVAH